MKTSRLILAVCLIAAACARSPKPVHISRLDRAMMEYRDAPDASKALIADSLSAEIDALFKVLGHSNPGKEELDWWSGGDEVAIFQPDAERAFPDLNSLEAAIGGVYSNADREGLRIDSLRFAAIVYGQPMPMVRVDSVMLIALNHYLGADFPGYSHWDAYKRTGKTAQALPYDLTRAIVATSFPMQNGGTPTLLANMLYEGALTQACMALLPCADLAQALDMTPDQLEFMEKHMPEIWREMAEKKMIYDTNPLTSDRMLSSAPHSPLMGGKAPARAGRFIGYCIVKAYMKSHPGMPMAELFNPAFYGKPATLAQANFNPNRPL